MSDINITVETIRAIEPHPQADRLEIAKILGTQCVVPKGEYKAGDNIVYFPPDMLVPGDVSEKLGVQKYLKHSQIEGLKIPCRVAACRLRTIPSYGFISPLSSLGTVNLDTIAAGLDVTAAFRGIKYEPPRVTAHNSGGGTGRAAPECPTFHEYTEIQNHYKYPDAIPIGTPVRVTEKIHGTNSRVGCVYHEGEFQFMAGSHHVNRTKENEGGVFDLLAAPGDRRRVEHAQHALRCPPQHRGLRRVVRPRHPGHRLRHPGR